jgi:hypothetical protein
MKIIAFFMNILHFFSKDIVSGKEFINDYTTTIFGTVYTSYDITSLKEGDSYAHHIPHIVHEFTHVLQFRRNWFTMPIKYLFSKNARAMYEAECFASHLEYAWKYELAIKEAAYKRLHLSEYITNSLKGLDDDYGIDSSQLLKVDKYLQDKLMFLQINPDLDINCTPVVETAIENLRKIGAAE